MNCRYCGNKIKKNDKFCSSCGNNICNKDEGTISSEIVNTTPKVSNFWLKIAVIAMAIIVVAIGLCIVFDIFSDDIDASNIIVSKNEEETPDNKYVKIAISALKQHWSDLYAKNGVSDGHLEIIHTRILKIDADKDGSFATVINNAENIKYIVEFDLYTDYYGSAPYYQNIKYDDTVLIYEDGSTNVTKSVLSVYAAAVYSYDYSEFLVNIKDYGDDYNQVFKLKYKENTDNSEETSLQETIDEVLETGYISNSFGIYDDGGNMVIGPELIQNISLCKNDESYYIKLIFTEEGKDVFAKVTQDNIGYNLPICIDNITITSPMINEQITDGVAVISMFGFEEADAIELYNKMSQ